VAIAETYGHPEPPEIASAVKNGTRELVGAYVRSESLPAGTEFDQSYELLRQVLADMEADHEAAMADYMAEVEAFKGESQEPRVGDPRTTTNLE
jgi:hypothetical protein